jgi:hypothetical protein
MLTGDELKWALERRDREWKNKIRWALFLVATLSAIVMGALTGHGGGGPAATQYEESGTSADFIGTSLSGAFHIVAAGVLRLLFFAGAVSFMGLIYPLIKSKWSRHKKG